MKCAGCGEMFTLHELRWVPDGMVEGLAMPKNNAFCKDCPKITIDGKPSEEKSDDESQCPF
jgi:hypothetical protein